MHYIDSIPPRPAGDPGRPRLRSIPCSNLSRSTEMPTPLTWPRSIFKRALRKLAVRAT